MDYLDQGRIIWQQFVPKAGQADTVQGEMLRAVEKLRDEAMRNGNGNWDQGFEILLGFLKDHLPDPQVFDAVQRQEIESALARLANYEEPLLDDVPYDMLCDRVCDYYRHHGSLPHTHNPELWR